MSNKELIDPIIKFGELNKFNMEEWKALKKSYDDRVRGVSRDTLPFPIYRKDLLFESMLNDYSKNNKVSQASMKRANKLKKAINEFQTYTLDTKEQEKSLKKPINKLKQKVLKQPASEIIEKEIKKKVEKIKKEVKK